MVYLLGWCQLALLLTLLTERMRLNEAVADALPTSSVALIGLGVSLVLVVLLVHDLLMLGTVLLTLGEPTATGVGTGTFGLVGHWVPPFANISIPIMKSYASRKKHALL